MNEAKFLEELTKLLWPISLVVASFIVGMIIKHSVIGRLQKLAKKIQITDRRYIPGIT